MHPRSSAALLGALLLTMALAGCIGGDDGEAVSPDAVTGEGLLDGVQGTVDGATGELVATDPGELPEWTHGDWWTYDITFDPGFGTFLDGETSVIVFGTGGQYAVAAADRNAAIVDAHFDMFLVGEIDRNLNPQGPFSYQMFDFPLEDGKTWTTQVQTFQGATEPMTLTATAVPDAADPTADTPGFQITGGTDSGAVTVDYTYSPASHWITRYVQTAVDFNGNPFTMLDMTLKDAGSAYEGSFVVLKKTDLYERFTVPIAPDPSLQQVPPVDTINVGDGFTFLQRFVGIFPFAMPPAPTVGAQMIGFTDPENNLETFESTGEFLVDNAYLEPAIAGDYHVGYAGHGTLATFVGVWGFSEEVIEFDAASHAHHQ